MDAMKFLGQVISWGLLTISGVCLFAAFVIIGSGRGGGSALWLAVSFGIPGIIVSHISSSKKCPQCSERVKVAALKCKHCSSDFPQLNAPYEGPASRRA